MNINEVPNRSHIGLLRVADNGNVQQRVDIKPIQDFVLMQVTVTPQHKAHCMNISTLPISMHNTAIIRLEKVEKNQSFTDGLNSRFSMTKIFNMGETFC